MELAVCLEFLVGFGGFLISFVFGFFLKLILSLLFTLTA